MFSPSNKASPPFLAAPHAKDPQYPFKKKADKFVAEETTLSVPVNETHHSIKRLHKVEKPNTNSSLRNKKHWIRVNNTFAEDNKQERLQAMIVATGEMMRFMIGKSHPKYRTMVEEDARQYYPVSEEIEGFTDFYDYYKAHIEPCGKEFNAAHYIAGMGRVIFYKYLNSENDFHFGNMAVNKHHQFVGFDHDQILAPVLLPWNKSFHRYTKHVGYDIRQHPTKAKTIFIDNTKNKKWRFLLPQHKIDFVGETNVNDYKTLPQVRYFIPTNWDFNNTYDYSKWLANYPEFLNEKHFSAVQAFLLQDIRNAVFSIHIENDADRVHAIVLIQDRLEAVLNDPAFKKYFSFRPYEILQGVLYEALEALRDNKHYWEKTSLADEWKNVSEKIIDQFPRLLKRCGLTPLNDEQNKLLADFVSGLYEKNLFALQDVSDFYYQQFMPSRCREVLDQMLVIKEKNTSALQPVETKEEAPVPLAAILKREDALLSPNRFFHHTPLVIPKIKTHKESVRMELK